MAASPKIPAICSHATEYHQAGITGKNVTVAVLDSGLAPHKEIAASRILAFQDFVHDHPLPYDDYSHGTHVTGIIGASFIGIAPDCQIVSLKVLDQHGNTSLDTMIESIKWILYHANTYHIRIVNLSIGSNPSMPSSQKILLNLWVRRLWESGLIVCCSAGNNGPAPNTITAPGNCPDVITVGSCDGSRFSSIDTEKFSLLPNKPEVCAPGVHILSLKPSGGYHIKNGTSMSTPFVSGYCALLLQCEPDLSNNEVKSRLIQSAAPLASVSCKVQGAGSIDLHTLLPNSIFK